MKFSTMLIAGATLFTAFFVPPGSAQAQTNPNATGKRVTYGPVSPGPTQSIVQAFVIPADQQQGIALEPIGDNSSLFGGATGAASPWFVRIQRPGFYIYSAIPAPPVGHGYDVAQNALAAYGEAGGGTPLYTDREYRFGLYAGGRSATLPGVFRVRAYQKSQFAGSAVDVTPVESTTFSLPWPGDSNWDAFLAAGSKQVVNFRGLRLAVEIVGGGSSDDQWHAYNTPYVLTHQCSDPDMYFAIDYLGWATAQFPIAAGAWEPGVSTATFRPIYTVDFTSRPPWRSTYVGAPQFTGKALPSEYVGMSQEELSGLGGFSPPVPAASYQTATTIGNTPELAEHPKLNKLVADLGNDAVAIANYVFNEIKLVDPIAYSEDGSTDPSGLWAGGMNRNAFGTFMEGAGNPWEQSALLVYMLRKAGYPAIYVEPYKDNLFLLDTQLEKILRMRIKGATDGLGQQLMPTEVPVHYPWVASYVPDVDHPGQSKWVHLFPWIKDTAVVEGGNLYEKFPESCKTGKEWVAKYLKADSAVLTDQAAAHLPNSAGDILFEAERYQDNVAGAEARHNAAALVDQWLQQTDTGAAGYSGGSWMWALGATGGSIGDFTNFASAPRLEYAVDLPAAGTYYVWLRAHQGSPDKCFVTFDDLAPVTADLPSGTTWQWSNTKTGGTPISFTVATAGRHTLKIGVNRIGFALDRILLTQNATLIPAGDGGTASAQKKVEPNVPSFQFTNFARNQLALKGASLDDMGMKYLDRKRNRTTFDEFPKPYRLNDALHTIYTKLSDRPSTFDTVRVYIKKDNLDHMPEYRNPNVILDTGDWLSMDLQNRPLYINTRKGGDGEFSLMMTLGAFRPGTVAVPNFHTADRISAQRAVVEFDYIPRNNPTHAFTNVSGYQMEITHVRQNRALKDSVTQIGVEAIGSNYTSVPTVTIAPPPNLASNPSYRTATAHAVISGGGVVSVKVIDPGYGYDFDASMPAVVLSGGGGTGTIARVLDTPSQKTDGSWAHPLGVETRKKTINRPVISEGDVGAVCLNFGTVSQQMVDHLAEDYWTYERQLKVNPGNANNIEFKEATQGRSAYLMGMDYYRRISEFRDDNARLHKGRVLSMYAAGLSKLQAYRSNYVYRQVAFYDVLSPEGPFYYSKPSVDMFFSSTAWTGSSAVHTDAGFPSATNTTDMWQLFSVEMSAQEHQIINDFYKEDAAISTVRLLQRAQTRPTATSPPTGAIKLTKRNYIAEGNNGYAHGPVGKALKDWHPGIWTAITNSFGAVDGDYAETYITPGNTASSSLSYNGMGAMILSKSQYSALIGGNQGFYNGGFGSEFVIPRYESNYLANNTLAFGATGYTLNYNSSTASNFYVAPAAVASWNMPAAYASILGGTSQPSSYQSLAWTQQASFYGVSGSTAQNYLVSESRGSLGATSFFGAATNLISSAFSGISSAIGNVASAVGGWVADPVDVVTGDFYIDAVDLNLPGPMPLSLRRNYSSLSVADAEFGHGWKSSIVPFLGVSDTATVDAPGKNVLYAAEADGSVIAYKKDATDANLFVPLIAENPSLKNINLEGAGSSSNPMNNRIVKSTEGTATIYTLSGPNGHVRRFKIKSYPLGSGANLISRERPYLESWKDAQGNELTFTYSELATAVDYGQLIKISSSNGNSLGFTYDTYGHIVEAWTQDGRRVSYEYDQQGDLVRVVLPDGAEHRYDYDQDTTVAGGESVRTSKHLLIRETKPEGRILENDYDSSRRVVRQRAIVGPGVLPILNAEFIYTSSQDSVTKTWTGTTTVKDAYNRETIYFYTDSLITSEDDPETPAEIRTWYGASEIGGGAYPRSLKSITDRRGVVKFFKYDSRGNVVEKSLGTDAVPADIDGDGVASPSEKSITSWTYNLKNLPETQTDPSGLVTKWFYEDLTYPYLASSTEKWVGSTLISKTLRHFGQRSAGGRSAKGLIEWEKTAEGSPDEAVIEWDYDERGFATKKTSKTGSDDPDSVVFLKHNLRGELTEEKQLASGTIPEQKWIYSYDAMGRRIISTRTAGALKSIEQVQYTLNGEVEWTDGRRTGVNDRVLNRYDKNGRQIEKLQWLSGPKADGSGVGDPVGDEEIATTFYSYDLFNNLTEIRTPHRHSIAAEYDAIGRLKRTDYYSGYKGAGGVIKGSKHFLYEPGGEVDQETDTLGGITKSFYNARGQLRRRENPDGSVEQWRFYSDGRPHKEILRNGSVKELIYDDGNRKVTETLRTIDGSVIKTAVSLYDRRGNLISETKGGYTTTTTYDDLNRVKTVTGPPATAQTAQRKDIHRYPDGSGRETRVTNSMGEATVTLRDALGRIESVETFAPNMTLVSKASHVYSADHNKITTTLGIGDDAIVTHSWTDTMDNPVLQKRADGTFTATVYQAGELPIVRRDAAGQFTYQTFDWLGKVASETRAGNVAIVYLNDSAGHVLEQQMPNGMIAKAEYDTAGRVQSTKLVQGGSTTRLITYDYYPVGHVWAGMLKSSTDARGIVTTRTYDHHLRMATATSDGATPESDLSQQFGYDELDHLVSLEETGMNGSTLVVRPANDAGAILSETVSVDGDIQSTVSQTFDGAGRRSERHAGDFTQSFGYRADGMMTVTSVESHIYQSAFNTAGNFVSRSGPFQSQLLLRDALGRITSRGTTVGATAALVETTPTTEGTPGWSVLNQLNNLDIARVGGEGHDLRRFQYDASHRLVAETYLPKAGASTNDLLEYYYDSEVFNSTGGIGSLIARHRGNNGALTYKFSDSPAVGDFGRITYSEYQGVTRPVSLAGVALGAQRVALSIDGLNIAPVDFTGWRDPVGAWTATANLPGGTYTLTASATHPSGSVAPPATSTFTVPSTSDGVAIEYDAVGNVLGKSWNGGIAQTFTWDAKNRLIKVVQTGSKAFVWSALYDGFDRRIQTTYTPQGADTTKVRQVYDPEVEFLEIGQGASVGTGTIDWAWKVYGIDRSGTFGGLDGLGGLEAVRDASRQWRGIVSDWWGNTVGWVERPGDTVTWNGMRFGAWGNVAGYNAAVQDGKVPLHELLGYRGLTTDPPGFLQMGLRPYDPLEGTWLSADPMGHEGSLSLYDYCDNDPVNLADPDGRFGKAVYKQTAIALTGYSGNTANMSGSQIWSSYHNSDAGRLHAGQIDSVLNWVPVVNVVKWTGEAISGRNFITGADLTTAQQIGAAFNVGASVLPAAIGTWSSSAVSVGTGSGFSNLSGPMRGFQNTAARPWGEAAESGLRGLGSRGVRNAEHLTDNQWSQIGRHIDELGLSGGDFLRSTHMSGYSDMLDKVFLGPNVFPAATGRVGGSVFERLTPRAVVAHEAGHLMTTRAGTSFAPGSLMDEVGASLAGRQLPGLSSMERYQLLRDAAERARAQGTTVRSLLEP